MLRVSGILHLLAIAGCLSSTGHECVAVKYYVTPTPPPNPACPSDHPCYTLDQYRQNASQFFTEKGNLTLIFLDGIHNLSKSLSINNFKYVIITANTNDSHNPNHVPAVTIQLAEQSTLTFSNLVRLQVHGVAIESKQLTVTNTATVILREVHILKCVLLIEYKGPQSVFPAELDNQHKQVRKNASKPSLTAVNVEQCTLLGSSIRVTVDSDYGPNDTQVYMTVTKCTAFESEGSVVSFEGGNRMKRSFVDLCVQDSYFTNTTTRGHTGMISIRLLSGWSSKVVINNTWLIQSHGEGVNITSLARGSVYMDITIENSTIMHQKHAAITVHHPGSGKVKVHLERCNFNDNHYGVELDHYHKTYTENLTISFSMNRTEISTNTKKGLFLRVRFVHLLKVDIEGCTVSHNRKTGVTIKAIHVKTLHIRIHNTTFASNKNGGMFLEILGQVDFNSSQIILQNCTVADNSLTSIVDRETGVKTHASGFSLWIEETLCSQSVSVTIKNVEFVGNNDHSQEPTNLQLLNLKNVTIQNCEFLYNHGSAIQAHFCKVTLSGTLLFKRNLALRGGGLSLLHSTILIQNNTNIDFINNSATDVGGAIFVRGLTLAYRTKSVVQCFYQLPDVRNISDLYTLNSSLNFNNNTSGNGGVNIYGAPLIDWCSVADGQKVRSKYAIKLFNFTNTHPKTSSISSNPKRVCLCDEYGKRQCANISYIFLNQTRYPGESFNLSLVLVGDEFGAVSGTVYGTLLKQEHSKYKLDPSYRSQEVGFKKCNDVEYSIHSTRSEETLVLTANTASIDMYGDAKNMKSYIKKFQNIKNPHVHGVIPSGLLSTSVFVNVTLEDCPLGFQLTKTLSCQCISSLIKAGIKNCEISNHTGLIHRSGTVWLMASYNGNESNGVVVHDSCPYHYCKEQDVPTDLRYPDTQCALNHSGILCGGCLPNLSLALGSNQCLPCSNNNHLALLVFFIAAGFMLVIFIKVLDLTVAKGTINGLIFYANIVWAYQSILFPPQDNTNLALQFLRVFLAWLNLDFGIETCFIKGLTAYWKTWLQFVFPIYIWLIAGFIIVTSNYFKLATKLFGNNSVPVLATLFLLSYAKLVRTIITVLGRAFLHYPDHKSVVWTFDGNLSYFGLEHTFLFVAALVALLFLWLPFVSTLLLVPWLKRKSHLKPLHWINRWKPFYDAYYGPLKDKHHYWVGFLLIVRGVLLVLFSLTSATAPDINILAMILTPSVLLLYACHIGNVYKNRLLSLFENLFFINMIFLGSGIFYIQAFKGSKGTILQISVWFAFAQFACILLFHVCCTLKLGKKCLGKCPNSETNQEQPRINTDRDEHDQLRESLLESVVQE